MDKDKQLIDELIRILSEKELSEINFEEKDFKIKIKKDLTEENRLKQLKKKLFKSLKKMKA